MRVTPATKTLPEDVVLVATLADVQAKYLALLTLGFGIDGQIWVLEWDEIEGSPLDPATFDALISRVHTARWRHPVFEELPTLYLGIDCGFMPTPIAQAARRAPAKTWEGRPVRWIQLFKGEHGSSADPPILPRKDRRDTHLRLNTMAVKDEVLLRLMLRPDAEGVWPAGAIHLPKWVAQTDLRQQFAAEEKREIIVDGVPSGEFRYVPVYPRNEGLDCLGMGLGLYYWLRSAQRGEDVVLTIAHGLVKQAGLA